jgi:D-alanine-D-alanine ligase
MLAEVLMGEKVRVGLVYGGKSGEHEVSLQTALAVIKAFDYNKYEIVPLFITRRGEWRPGPLLEGPVASVAELQFDDSGNYPAVRETALAPLFRNMFAAKRTERAIDVVFPLLHGTYGEDGTIQGLLEMADIPYVGAGVLASAVGMDKAMMKTVFAQAELPQCLYRYFTLKQWEKDQSYFIMEVEISLGYPCFVKPANLGSSVGVSKAHNREELIQAVQEAFRYDRKVIVEEFIDAREIEVSVLGNDEPAVSVPGEIVPSNEFYDYNAKYIDGKSTMIIPADLPQETVKQVQELAVRAFQAIDGSGLARVDFFLSKTDGRLLINELNTMPGFTPYSMYPLLWQHSGLTYAELLDRLIALAMERHEEKRRIEYGG